MLLPNKFALLMIALALTTQLLHIVIYATVANVLHQDVERELLYKKKNPIVSIKEIKMVPVQNRPALL